MRAYDISLFAMCVIGAIALVMPTGAFATGPAGAEMNLLGASVAVGALALGGVAILGFSFKLPAAITAFGALFAAASAVITVFVYNFIPRAGPADSTPEVIASVIVGLLFFIGLWATWQVAKGPMGPEE